MSSRGCTEHCRLWFASRGLSYDGDARAAFAQAHPVLFGGAYDVALHGYERWLLRSQTPDCVESFATFLEGRFERWTADLARCQFRLSTGRPL
jgi:hypothetical protein